MLDAHAERIIRKARKAVTPLPMPELFNEKAMKCDAVSDERLRAAYQALASIIVAQGDQYLPLFKRLHAEINERLENKKYAKIVERLHLSRDD